MAHAIPPIRPWQQVYLRPAATKVALLTTTTDAADSKDDRQRRPNPEGQNWPAVRNGPKYRMTGSFAEIIQEEERTI